MKKMTRINCIPVEELHNKHLVAEYRELPRVFKLARPCPDAPNEYVLGSGHVKFFYDKLLYLYNRQVRLYNEMLKRGFKPNYNPRTLKKLQTVGFKLWNDWTPTEQALALNRARIQERLETMR
jgi:deoxyribonuclease (pyrimidine dimer)